MAQGKVKWFDQKKGFGFIEQSEGTGADLFVHFSAMKEAGTSLNEGDIVEYTIAPGAKGEMATEVAVITRSETTTSTSQSQPISRPPRRRNSYQGDSKSINRSLEDQLMALRKSAKENQQDLSNRLKRR